MAEQLTLKIYADKACTKPITTISWKNTVEFTDATGKPVKLEQTAKGGERAEAEVWIRNETHYDFVVQEISFPDPRVNAVIGDGWLTSMRAVSIMLTFIVPKVPTPSDIIKEGKLLIQGYYIFK